MVSNIWYKASVFGDIFIVESISVMWYLIHGTERRRYRVYLNTSIFQSTALMVFLSDIQNKGTLFGHI